MLLKKRNFFSALSLWIIKCKFLKGRKFINIFITPAPIQLDQNDSTIWGFCTVIRTTHAYLRIKFNLKNKLLRFYNQDEWMYSHLYELEAPIFPTSKFKGATCTELKKKEASKIQNYTVISNTQTVWNSFKRKIGKKQVHLHYFGCKKEYLTADFYSKVSPNAFFFIRTD